MSPGSVHVSQSVRCAASAACAYARDPRNLSAWASGLGGPVVEADGRWVVRTADGDVVVEFVPENEHGVLDHVVVLPDGTRVLNPLRVIPDGDDCEVVFTLRRRPGMTDADVEDDRAAVARDLLTLARLLEARAASG